MRVCANCPHLTPLDIRWGFDDTNFELNENGMVQLAGSRYSYAFKAARILPKLRAYMSETVGLEFRCAKAN